MKLVVGLEDLAKVPRRGMPGLEHLNAAAAAAAVTAEEVIFDLLYEERRDAKGLGQVVLKSRNGTGITRPFKKRKGGNS